MFIVNWVDVPDNVVDIFADEFIDIEGEDEEFNNAVAEVLKTFNAAVVYEDDVYKVEFENEACYNWFLLRYSS